MRPLSRISCYLLGCEIDPGYYCTHCGAYCEDETGGWHDRPCWLVRAWRVAREPNLSWLYRRCEVCHRLIWLSPTEPCCSQKCYDGWIPF